MDGKPIWTHCQFYSSKVKHSGGGEDTPIFLSSSSGTFTCRRWMTRSDYVDGVNCEWVEKLVRVAFIEEFANQHIWQGGIGRHIELCRRKQNNSLNRISSTQGISIPLTTRTTNLANMRSCNQLQLTRVWNVCGLSYSPFYYVFADGVTARGDAAPAAAGWLSWTVDKKKEGRHHKHSPKVSTGNIPHRQWSERNKQTVLAESTNAV